MRERRVKREEEEDEEALTDERRREKKRNRSFLEHRANHRGANWAVMGHLIIVLLSNWAVYLFLKIV